MADITRRKLLIGGLVAMTLAVLVIVGALSVMPPRHWGLFLKTRTSLNVELIRNVTLNFDVDPVPWFVLSPALRDEDQTVRVWTAACLHEIRSHDPQVKKTLLSAMSSSDARARYTALMFLSQFYESDQEVLEVCLRALNDADATVRATATTCLSAHGERSGKHAQVIAELLHDKDGVVVQSAVAALAMYGSDGLPFLVGALSSNDNLVRSGAALSLFSMAREQKDPRYIKPLEAAVDTEEDEKVRQTMRSLLRRFSELTK